MRKVIGIGETLLDIIFKDNKPVEAVPGGSTFNAIVSLGRVGADAFFVTETGDDHVGALVRPFLSSNNVCTDYVLERKGWKSPVSLAFLDSDNNANTHSIATPMPTPSIYHCPISIRMISCSLVRFTPLVLPLVRGS